MSPVSVHDLPSAKCGGVPLTFFQWWEPASKLAPGASLSFFLFRAGEAASAVDKHALVLAEIVKFVRSDFVLH